MSLQVKCTTCSQALTLDDSFLGAACRCRNCRALVDVPKPPRRLMNRPAKRPARPRLAGVSDAKTQPVRREAQPARWSRRMTACAAMLFGLVGTGSAWYVSTSTPPEVTALAEETALVMQNSQPAVPAFDAVLREFFSTPVSGQTVGFVVDGDLSMVPYSDGVAFLIPAVATRLDPKSRFAVSLATETTPTVLQPRLVTQASIAGAESTLVGNMSAGKTDLAAALSASADWRADQIFLVVANPSVSGSIELLIQHAKQTGAELHVVALGEARSSAALALGRLSQAVGGSFHAIDDAAFSTVISNAHLALAQKGPIEKVTRDD